MLRFALRSATWTHRTIAPTHQSPVFFPIRIDDAVIDSTEGWAAKLRRQRHIGDFKRWKDRDAYQAAFDRLLRDLQADV